ncbi:hypothetical protein HYS94_02575 [Candidatus Daviesbacteria bacterium]|nr:hypothetical protein [Candidatus Daviesbacteria bacterium]
MKERGVTISEALIVLAITALVGSILTAIIVNSTGLFYKESSKVQQGLGLNDALAKIRVNVKEASSIASSFVDQGTTYTSSATQLVLQVPSIDSGGNIIANTFDHVVIYLDGTLLRFKLFPNQLSSRILVDEILTTVAEAIVFKYYDSANPPQEVSPIAAEKVQISLTVKQKAGANFETATATSEANLRND